MVTFARNHQKFTNTSSTDNRAFRACLKLFKIGDILTGLLSWFHTLIPEIRGPFFISVRPKFGYHTMHPLQHVLCGDHVVN